MLDAINEGLAAEGKVILPGFGSFEVRNRTAHGGRNPRTGEQFKIDAARVPAFKPGKAMKDVVSKNCFNGMLIMNKAVVRAPAGWVRSKAKMRKKQKKTNQLGNAVSCPARRNMIQRKGM